MKNIQKKEPDKVVQTFNIIYFGGIIFSTIKLLGYLQWTFELIRKWELPEKPFFSKVDLINSDVEISIASYLVFAIAYILAFGCTFLGFYQLNKITTLFAKNKFFQEEISFSFEKAGKFFIYFVIGTLIIDITFLAWSQTSKKIINLLSTELIVFLIFGYILFFLSSVFKKVSVLKDKNY